MGLIFNGLENLAPTLLRLALALVFIPKGMMMFKGAKMMSKKMGLSAGVLSLAGLGKLLAGLGLLVGVLTEIAALGIVVIMLGALYLHWFKQKAGFMSGKDALVMLLMSLAVAFLGPGSYSLGALIGWP